MASSVALVSPAEVNKRLLAMQRRRDTQVLQFAILMDRAEGWVIDDIQTDPDGTAIGISNEKGTAAEKIAALERLQEIINTDAFVEAFDYVMRQPQIQPLEEGLYDLCRMVKTSRFLVILEHLNAALRAVNQNFPEQFVQRLYVTSQRNSISAHVLFQRIVVLSRLSMIRAVFSEDAAKRIDELVRELAPVSPPSQAS